MAQACRARFASCFQADLGVFVLLARLVEDPHVPLEVHIAPLHREVFRDPARSAHQIAAGQQPLTVNLEQIADGTKGMSRKRHDLELHIPPVDLGVVVGIP